MKDEVAPVIASFPIGDRKDFCLGRVGFVAKIKFSLKILSERLANKCASFRYKDLVTAFWIQDRY